MSSSLESSSEGENSTPAPSSNGTSTPPDDALIKPEQDPIADERQLSFPFSDGSAGHPGTLVGIRFPAPSNAEMEVVRRVTPEHISLELSNSHARALRHFDIHEKAIENERRERDREHERDRRDRDERRLGDNRLERMFYVVFATVAGISVLLVLKDKTDLALKFVGGFAALFVTLAGGVGVERLRQDRANRRARKPDGDSE